MSIPTDTPRRLGDKDAPHLSPVTPDEDARTVLLNRISWGAVLAGVVVGLVVQLILNMIGLGIGAVLAYAGGGLLKAVLFGIEPGDPRIFAAAVMVLLLVGGIAAWIPARRTGRIEPSAALRID